MHIRVNDTVKVIAGADKEVEGKVLSVDHQKRKLIVEGVNRVYKHVRRSQRNPQGGRLSKEMPIQTSNVMWVCTSCGKPTKNSAPQATRTKSVAGLSPIQQKSRRLWQDD